MGVSLVPVLVAAMSLTLSPAPPGLADRVQQVAADLGALDRKWPLELSPRGLESKETYLRSALADAETLRPDPNDREAQADKALLRLELGQRLTQIARARTRQAEVAALLPFRETVTALDESLREFKPVDGRASAETLDTLVDEVKTARGSIDSAQVTPMRGLRAAGYTADLRRSLEGWFRFYDGYDPEFGWWCRKPFEAAATALREYEDALRTKFGPTGDGAPITGDPVGRDALIEALRADLIPYDPERLVEIARREYAWCLSEMKKASAELGFGDDWLRALEHVKRLHVAPGEQPELIRELAVEAIAFLKERDLVTVPPLAEETWRMAMMSPEQQLVSPFFLGGESIVVAFPTDAMGHDAKLMSLRGNNRHFARATVQHELIPGHHLQQFMNARYRPYRNLFSTPFWIEGWALYWEMRLWDLGFPKTPEDRIGMLFWRMHRCARIEFSLGFHLGEMSAAECVEFLVQKVGHERANAEAEVRRSFGGQYPPLYQLAYMIGGLQFRSLHTELVGSGRMTEKAFHDAVLQAGQMPVAVVRALLAGHDFEAEWRFDD